MLHHPDKEAYSGTQTGDMTFKRLFRRLWAAGSWYFLPAATVWVRFRRVVWRERWVGVHMYSVCVCVYLLPASLCAPVRVFVLYAWWVWRNEDTTSAKGTCSNYGQPCSLNALPHCTLLLHQPDIPPPSNTHSASPPPQVICRYTAQCCAHNPPGVYCLHCDLGTWPSKALGRLIFFLWPAILHFRLISGRNMMRDSVWKRLNECWKTLTHGYKSAYICSFY